MRSAIEVSGGRELLAEAAVAVHPVDRGVVAPLVHEVAGVRRDRVVGVVVDLAAHDDGHPLVEQAHEGAHHAGLGLAPFAQEHDVVTGEQGVGELGNDGVLVSDDTLDEQVAVGERGDRVGPELLLDRSRDPTAGA